MSDYCYAIKDGRDYWTPKYWQTRLVPSARFYVKTEALAMLRHLRDHADYQDVRLVRVTRKNGGAR